MYKFIAIILLMSLIAINAYSQNTASGGVNATIVETVNIPKSIEPDLERVSVIAGTVVMTPDGAHSKTGNISLPVCSGTFTGAAFQLSGKAGYSYTITMPTSPLTVNNGANSMKVSSFTSDCGLLAGAGLIAGIYVSVTPFNVTVNYN